MAAEFHLWCSDGIIEAQLHANLGYDFLDEVDVAIGMIQLSPEAWPPFHDAKNTRRFLVHRFPFGIISRHVHDVIDILAISH